MEEVLSRGSVQVVVLPIDWKVFLNQFPPGYEPPLYSEFAHAAREVGRVERASQQRSDIAQKLSHATPAERKELLADSVRAEVLRVLGLAPTYPLDMHKGLFEMGMDSLMAVELKTRLQNSLGTALPSTLAFDYPTVNDLVRFMSEEVFAVNESNGSPALAQQENSELNEILAEIEQLSEDAAKTALVDDILKEEII